jgi:hypothetical protein
MLDHYKTNPLSRYLDIACVASVKTAKKPLSRTHRIKSPDTLQTFAHGLNSNGYKIFQVAWLSRDQNDWEILIGCDGIGCALFTILEGQYREPDLWGPVWLHRRIHAPISKTNITWSIWILIARALRDRQVSNTTSWYSYVDIRHGHGAIRLLNRQQGRLRCRVFLSKQSRSDHGVDKNCGGWTSFFREFQQVTMATDRVPVQLLKCRSAENKNTDDQPELHGFE